MRKYDLKMWIVLLSVLVLSCSHIINQDEEVTVSFLALGDSYTIGQSVDLTERWPAQLADSLRNAGIEIEQPQIIARTGWTTADLNAAIAAKELAVTYDFVSLLIGVNNQFQGRDIDEYRLQFRDLLQQSIAYADGKAQNVLVLSIPDWGVTPYAQGRDRNRIADEINAFNGVNFAETQISGARYINVTPVSREATNKPSLLANDGLHPSGEMYGRWVKLVLPEVLEILNNTNN